jgi:hypothetical protein
MAAGPPGGGAPAPHYVSPRGRAIFVVTALIMGMFLDVAGAVLSVFLLGLIARSAAGEAISDAEAAVIDGGNVVVGLAQMVVYFAGAIGFLMWVHRAAKNLRALGATNLEFTPGWAVGYYFVPILNLFKPYQAMKEIWRESDPRLMTYSSKGLKEARLPFLFPLWWSGWILGNIASQVSLRVSLRDESLPALQMSEGANVAASAFALVAAVCLCQIVWKITTFQDSLSSAS